MDEQILSVLEKRITEMERQVFGRKPYQVNTEATIAEDLLNSHTMITSALSCRDGIVKLLQHLPQLNDFLDPTFPNNELEIEAKRQYILLLYPDLKILGFLLQEFNRVQKFADSEPIANVPKLCEKLDSIVSKNVNTYTNSVNATQQVLDTINKYNDILSGLEVLFMQFDHTAAQIEYDLRPKMPSTNE